MIKSLLWSDWKCQIDYSFTDKILLIEYLPMLFINVILIEELRSSV